MVVVQSYTDCILFCFLQLRSNESGYSSEGLGDCLNITRLRPEGSPMSIDSQGSLPGTRADFYPGTMINSMQSFATFKVLFSSAYLNIYFAIVEFR